MSSHRIKAYLYLLSVAAIWGIAGPIIKFTLQGLDPYTFLIYRFAISTIFSTLTILISKPRFPKNPKTLFELLIWGFITSTVALGLLFLGLEKTTVVDMTIITMASPLMVTFAGAYLLHEHITKKEKVGITIALIGTILTTTIGPITGNLLIAISLVASTISAVLAKRLVQKGVSPSFMVSLSFIIGFLSLLPFAPSTILPTLLATPYLYHLGVIFMALISGNLAYILWVQGQKTIEISEASVFGYLNPVFALPLAVLWLNEKIYTNLLIGLVIIVAGVFIAETKTPSKS